ncbi:MAG TPA: envelope stress response membrane protein PspC [Stellaceae bacterium]|nr:envelope stress response membrane protein PspC [Stellaceae bacterium]
MFSAFDRLGRLYRDPERGLLAGVCAGIAEYVGLRPVQMRLLAIVGLVFFFVPTVIVYVALALALPAKPPDLYRADDEAQFWRTVRTAPNEALSALRARCRSAEQRLADIESLIASEEYQLRRKFRDIER